MSLEDFIRRGADLEEMSGRLGVSGRENAHFKSAEIVVVFRNPPVFKYQLGKTVKPSVVFDPCRGPLNEQDFLFTRSDRNVGRNFPILRDLRLHAHPQ